MYGIIGYPLQTTFSPDYFNEKFNRLGIEESYEKFPLERIETFEAFISIHKNLKGLSVTMPHKQSIIPFLNELDNTAKAIGAVNCIQLKNGKLKGYNTDVIGFQNSLKPLLKGHHSKALILGTGGASKAVAYALQTLNIPFQFVSRENKEGQLTYSALNESIIDEHKLIINTTPLGMKPNEGLYPAIPYTSIGSNHLLFDLIYQPEETPFLLEGKKRNAAVKNGYEMLILQAEAAWAIWNM